MNWFKWLTKRQEVKVDNIDYNTIKIRSVKELDEFEKIKLKKDLAELSETIIKQNNIDTAKQKEEHRLRYEMCPVCHGSIITNRIEVSQKTSGYGKYQSMSTVSTKINKCSNCSNEWEHYDLRIRTTSQDDIADYIIRYLRAYHNTIHVTKDDNTICLDTENTVEIAIGKIKDCLWAEMIKQYMSGRSIELVRYIVEIAFGRTGSRMSNWYTEYEMEQWNKYDKAPLLELGIKSNKI